MTAGPCPSCGGTGRVLDGTFDFVGDVMRVVTASDYTRRQLKDLARAVEDLRRRVAEPEEVEEELERLTGQPVSLEPRTPLELAAYLTILWQVLHFILSTFTPQTPGKPVRLDPADLERVVDEVMRRLDE